MKIEFFRESRVKARDDAEAEKRSLSIAKIILEASGSPRLKRTADPIYDQIKSVNTRIDDIDRVLVSTDYAMRRFQEVDEGCAYRIKNAGAEFRGEKKPLAPIKNVSIFGGSIIDDGLNWFKNTGKSISYKTSETCKYISYETTNTASWAWGGIKGETEDVLAKGRVAWELYKLTSPSDAGCIAGTYDFTKGLLYDLPKLVVYDIPKAFDDEEKAFGANPLMKSMQYLELIRVVTDDRLCYERIIKPMGIGIKDSFYKEVVNGDEDSKVDLGPMLYLI